MDSARQYTDNLNCYDDMATTKHIQREERWYPNDYVAEKKKIAHSRLRDVDTAKQYKNLLNSDNDTKRKER